MSEATHKPLVLNVYNTDGEVVSTKELDPRMFGVTVNEGLVHEAVIAQQANARTVNANTKTKGEVRGGGKKPWKQKGTGRARHGSSRSPIWRGGGITFGPRSDRNFSLKINKKARRKALFMVLSDKASAGNMILVQDLDIKDGKTKAAVAALNKLPIKIEGRRRPTTVGVVTTGDMTNTQRAMRNVPNVSLVAADALNVVEVLACKKLLVSIGGLEVMEKTYLKAKA